MPRLSTLTGIFDEAVFDSVIFDTGASTATRTNPDDKPIKAKRTTLKSRGRSASKRGN